MRPASTHCTAWRASCVAALLAGLAGAASAAAEFSVFNLGLYPNNGATPLAVNASGQATGFSTVGLTGTKEAFWFDQGVVSNLHHQGGLLLGGFSGSLGYGINDAGTVVGQALRTNITAYVPFVSTHGGTMVEIASPLGGSAGGAARDINNQGLVVGSSYTTGNAALRAYTYDLATGTAVNLGGLGGTQSEATSVNDLGQVAGWGLLPNFTQHAFRYSGGVLSDLGTLGGSQSFASGINDAGTVVGWADTAAGSRHAFRHQGGTMVDLGTLFASGAGRSEASGINDAGWIVGTSEQAFVGQFAFLYRNGAMVNLNSLIDPNLGLRLVTASAVSDTGYIVGTGFNALNQGFQYVLTPTVPLPVPEPGSWALLAAGLGVVATTVRRRQPEAA